MNSDPLSPKPSLSLPQHKHEPVAANVPVFNCIVYVAPRVEGGVQARVGNLEGFTFEAGSEREVLGKVVAAFKQHVKQATEAGETIPWIDPPSPPTSIEQTRFIPVHL